MLISKELFEAVGFSQVFSTLNLRISYDQLPLLLKDGIMSIFWIIN